MGSDAFVRADRGEIPDSRRSLQFAGRTVRPPLRDFSWERTCSFVQGVADTSSTRIHQGGAIM